LSIPRRTFRSRSEPVTSGDLPDAVETDGELPCRTAVFAPETAPGVAGETGGTVATETPQAGPVEADGAQDCAPAPEASLEPASEPAETAAAETPPAAQTPLERARAALAANAEALARLIRERDAALVADADDEATQIYDRIEALQRTQRALTDKVTLLSAQAAEFEAAEAAKAREAKIAAAESLLSQRLRLAEELAGHVKAADECFLRLLAANRVIEAAWPWEPTRHAGAVLLGDRPMLMALKNEIYRVAGRPNPLGGLPDHADGPGYPGGHPELLQWAQMPEKSAAPMADKFELASRAASQIMRVGRVVDAVPYSNAGQAEQSPARPAVGITGGQSNVPTITPEMAEIISRQMQLALRDDPESEAEYLRNGELLAAMSA
jgi:hypothetical protein